MTPENQELVREKITVAAEKLIGRLPDHPRHPAGRNPYAHIASVIIELTGSSYKDLPDDYLETVLYIINHCEKNPF